MTVQEIYDRFMDKWYAEHPDPIENVKDPSEYSWEEQNEWYTLNDKDIYEIIHFVVTRKYH